MKEFFKQTARDKIIRIEFISACFLSFLSFLLILFSYANLPPFIPIFNQLPWGDQRLGKTLTIFVPLILSSLIICWNLITAGLIYQRYPLVSRILSTTSAIVAILVFLFLIKTIKLIT